MANESGFVILVGILIAVTVIGVTLIQMPLNHSEGDDDGAYLGYHVESVEQYEGKTYAVVTVVNHGYADCHLTSYNVCYKMLQPKAGMTSYYIQSPSNSSYADCPKNGACVITAIFDTDAIGEITMISPNYRFAEY